MPHHTNKRTSSPDRFNVHRFPLHGGSSVAPGLQSCRKTTDLERVCTSGLKDNISFPPPPLQSQIFPLIVYKLVKCALQVSVRFWAPKNPARSLDVRMYIMPMVCTLRFLTCRGVAELFGLPKDPVQRFQDRGVVTAVSLIQDPHPTGAPTTGIDCSERAPNQNSFCFFF
ncbi:hypothetical protein TNCV_3467361 [Trichonephila clavipes]|nr:hypothetical protein TNCV_3467361 [Trichonephila clavipes]